MGAGVLIDSVERGRISTRVGAVRGALTVTLALVASVGTGCSATESNGPSMAVIEGEDPEGDGRGSDDMTAAVVVHVVDGDTLDVEMPDGTIERVRPPQIDTPEAGECGYDAATTALEALIMGRKVWLVPTEHGPDRDEHSRLLRAVEIGGLDVGERLLEEGFARWVPHYADEDSRLAGIYEAAENAARTGSAGFWSECEW